MFGYIFRTGTYFFLWTKFKKEIITLMVSVILLVLVFSIYNDLLMVMKITDTQHAIGLLLLKWFIVICIVGFNIFNLKTIKIENTEAEYKEVIPKSKPIQHQHILEKKKLKTKTDVILQKYLDK